MEEITIGLVITSNPPHNVVQELNGFQYILGKKFNLHIIGADPNEVKSLKTDGIDYFSSKRNNGSPFDCYFAVRQYLSNKQPDILINVARQFRVGIPTLIAGKRSRTRVVLRVLSDYMSCLYNNKLSLFKHEFLHNTIATEIYKTADAILTNTPNVKDFLIEKNYSKNKITYVPQPFNAKPFMEIDPTETKDNAILFVGSLVYRKGVDRLIEIANRLPVSQYVFYVAGDGPMRDNLRTETGSNVNILGSVGREKLRDLYSRANLLLLPSRREGLPFVILEAIAARVPVVSTPTGAIPDYVTNTFDNVGDMVGYIRKGEIAPETYPDWFNLGLQRDRYDQLFYNIINS